MPLIREADRRKLSELFTEQLADNVTLRFFTQRESPLNTPIQECFTCRQTGELLTELASLDSRLILVTYDFYADTSTAQAYGVERIPALVLEGRNKGRVRFYGIPAGYEFSVLVQDLVGVSTGRTQIPPDITAQLAGLAKPIDIKVLVTPT